MRRAVYLDFSTPLFESESQLKGFFSSLSELSRYIQKTKNIKFIYDCWNIVPKEKVDYFNYKYMTLSKNYF